MNTTATIRAHNWRDTKTLVAMTADEGLALKILGERWHCRTLQRVGEQTALADANALVFAEMTARNIVAAQAFASSELASWDEDNRDFWGGTKSRAWAGLKSLLHTLAVTRETLGF